MENENIILNELKDISQVVAAIANTHPYKVLETYFDTLPGEVMDRIKTQEEQIALPFIKEDQKNPFQIPSPYFENLGDLICNRIKALEALSPKEELEALSPLLVQADKTPRFNKPAEYFEELSSDILAGVNAIDFVNHELETLPFILSAVNKENVYRVPDNYFKYLPNQLLNRIKHQQKDELNSSGFKNRLIRYAIAALIAGAMAVGTWEFFQVKPSAIAASERKAFDRISDNVTISDDEIANYLEHNSATPSENNSPAFPDLKEEEVKELLADVSDEELQQYLEQHTALKDLTTN